MMVSILRRRRLRSQADSVANLRDGSDKVSLRNPKMDLRDFILPSIANNIVVCNRAYYNQ